MAESAKAGTARERRKAYPSASLAAAWRDTNYQELVCILPKS
jgi:hypothetical protein